jgi:hypothetical protein
MLSQVVLMVTLMLQRPGIKLKLYKKASNIYCAVYATFHKLSKVTYAA